MRDAQEEGSAAAWRWRRRIRRSSSSLLALALALVVRGAPAEPTATPAAAREAPGAVPASVPSPARGDLILVVVDTLRARNLSFQGYERETAPNLARFAEDAITYENAISPGTWTVPAHGSLFTGRLPSFHGAERVGGKKIVATPLNPEVDTLAELLGRAGWPTGAFVANETYVSPDLGFHRGFDEFLGKNQRAEAVLGASLRWLEEQKKPAFAFVNLLDPHEPYLPPQPFDSLFAGRDAELGGSMTELVHAGKPVTREIRSHFTSQYDGEVAYTDRSLAAFFERLRALGRYDNALIVLTSDHGEMLGEHGAAGHGGQPYEELVHVPLVVKLPENRRAGARVALRVSTIGVFATILRAAGLDTPTGAASVSLDEPHRVWVEDVNFIGERVTVGYEGTKKLVHFSQNPHGADPWANLYDLSSDPTEEKPGNPMDAVPLAEAVLELVQRVRPKNPLPAPAIEPERRRKLRALGYVE